MTFEELCTISPGDRVVLSKRVLIYPEGTVCVAVDNSTLGQLLVCLEGDDPGMRFYVGIGEINFPPVAGATVYNLIRDYRSQGRVIEKGRAVHVIREVMAAGGIPRGYWVHPTGNPSFTFYVTAEAVGNPFDPPPPERRPAVIGGLPRKVRF